MKFLKAGKTLINLVVLSVTLSFIFGCSGRERPSPVFILEELEAASNVDQPDKRVERLKAFLTEHPDHPYRIQAYRKIIETFVKDKGDLVAAEGFLREALAVEKEPWIRGELLFEKYSYLEEADSLRALAFADTLLSTERYPRLFFYVGYMVGRHKGYEDLAGRCFEKAIMISQKSQEKAQIRSFYGSFLMRIGEREKAMNVLQKASGYPTADAILADALWKEGRREKAIEHYIKYAAVMPGARDYVKLDSLYSVVHGDAAGLNAELLSERLVDGGELPDHVFFDINGRRFNLSDFKGKKLVLYVWSPT